LEKHGGKMTITDNKIWQPLPRAEVIKAIERQNPSRIPIAFGKWWGEGLDEQYGERLTEFDRYPDDIVQLFIEPLDFDSMGLSWEISSEGAHDAFCVLDDWAKLDEFIEKMPDPENDPQIEQLIKQAGVARAEDRYILFGWWRLFFERPWAIRSMTTLLMDYYLYPNEIHKLNDALCTLYCGYLNVAIRELKPDGFFTSDDLGHQTQLFMRPETFRTFLKPYYLRVGEVTKGNGLHWWLHSCGNNTAVLGDLAEAGVNVFHPVQKGTMDEIAVAQEFGDKMTFLAGIDVQHTLQEKDPAGVREEVRFLIDTFDQSNGGMMIAAGNGIVSGTPFENIAAFLDESATYGTKHRQQFR
jgi:uroporphyrinogen decarboxylase